MRFKRFLILGVAMTVAACSSSSGPEGSLEVTISTPTVTVPEGGTADVSLSLANTGGGTVIVDLCSERIAAGLQEQVSGVWIEAGSNSCGGSARRSVDIGGGSSYSTTYALSRPGTFRLRIPFRNSAGDFAELTTASFQATR